MRLVTSVLAAVVALAGCDGEACRVATADCQTQVRLEDRVYTSYGYTDRDASRFGSVDRAECHDVGCDAKGSHFPEQPRQVRAWSFAGYDTDKVLGVRFDKDSFAVFVADSIPRAESERIFQELARP